MPSESAIERFIANYKNKKMLKEVKHGSYQRTKKECLHLSKGGMGDSNTRRYILLKMSFKIIFKG